MLRGLTPRERFEFKRQLLIPVKEGADPIGLLIFVGPLGLYWLVLLLVLVRGTVSDLGVLALFLPFPLVMIVIWHLLERRLVRSHFTRVTCPECRSGFVQSRPGALMCAEGHWTDVQLLWPALHPGPRLNVKLGVLRVRSHEEFRRYPELGGFSEGEARLLLEQAKTWNSAAIGRAGMLAMVAGYGVGAATLAALALLLLGVLSALGLRGPAHDGVVMVAIAVSLVGAVYAGLVSARALMRRAIRQAVERRLSTSTCGFCGYSLREIPREIDGVRCPECGQFTPFRAAAQHSAS